MIFVKDKSSGDLVKIEQLEELISPLSGKVRGRRQAGEEEQDQQEFLKSELVFPSGENLPECWRDESYQLPD